MRAFLIAFLIPFLCSSQENDSLLYQIQQIDNDTEKVNQLYLHGFSLRHTDPETAFQFATAGEKAALKSKSPFHIAKSYNLLGILFYKKGDYGKALGFQKKALALNQSIKNENGAALNLTNLGNIYSDINYPVLAENFYLQALKSYNANGNTIQLARCLLNIGVLKYSQNQSETAIKQFEQALHYASQIGDHDLIASCYNNIGTILREQHKPDSALIYLEEALKIREQTDNELEMADSYNNIANVYIVLKNFNLASNYLSLAENVCRKYNYLETMVEVYHSHSLLSEAQQNYQLANTWLKKYYALKDSLKSEELADQDIDFAQDEVEQQSTTAKRSKNNWLIIGIIGMLIGFPLILMRYKR